MRLTNFVCAVVVLFMSAEVCGVCAQNGGHWDARFAPPGVLFKDSPSSPTDNVTALAIVGDYVVVAGQFTIPGRNIALWNRRTHKWEQCGGGVWSPVTRHSQPFDYAEILGMLADGDSVFVWGRFTTADNQPANGFAIFHPASKQWRVDTSYSADIRSAVRHGSQLLFSGSFSQFGTELSHFASYDNGSWNMTPACNDGGIIADASLCVMNDTLYAASTGLHNSKEILMRWDGMKWSTIIDSAGGLYSTLRCVGSARHLYLTGYYDSLHVVNKGWIPCRVLAHFDGSSWQNMSDTLGPHWNYAATALQAKDDQLWIGGNFTALGSTVIHGIAQWSGSSKSWRGCGSGIDSIDSWFRMIRSIAVIDSELYCAGSFTYAGNVTVNNVACFNLNSRQWTALAGSETLAPDALSFVFNDGPELMVIGDFKTVASERMNYVAHWNGRRWSSVGSGIVGGFGYDSSGSHLSLTTRGGLYSFARSSRNACLTGIFDRAGDVNCHSIIDVADNNLRCLDGGLSKSFLGSTGGVEYPAKVLSCVAVDSAIAFCGDFLQAGSQPCFGAALWDGTRWKALAQSISLKYGQLSQLSMSLDSAHHILISCQDLETIDGISVNSVARLGQHGWEAAIPPDYTCNLNHVCIAPDGSIYGGGRVYQNGNRIVDAVGHFDGTQWDNLGAYNEFGTMIINAMAIKGDWLYVTGVFDSVATIRARNVARYNLRSKQWFPLGSGLYRLSFDSSMARSVGPNSIAFLGDTVYFGGDFVFAGGQPSYNIAAWIPDRAADVESAPPLPFAQSLRCYPNPATHILHLAVELPASSDTELELVDALGRCLLRLPQQHSDAGYSHFELNVEAVPAGVYTLHARSSFGNVFASCVVLH